MNFNLFKKPNECNKEHYFEAKFIAMHRKTAQIVSINVHSVNHLGFKGFGVDLETEGCIEGGFTFEELLEKYEIIGAIND